MNRNLIITSLLGALTIGLGAFGAHVLKASITEEQLRSFETAVRYQMFHIIVLLIINLYAHFNEKFKNRISSLFFIGILLFSGSIYAITFGVDASKIWFLTPIGGLVFIIGWIQLAYYFLKRN